LYLHLFLLKTLVLKAAKIIQNQFRYWRARRTVASMLFDREVNPVNILNIKMEAHTLDEYLMQPLPKNYLTLILQIITALFLRQGMDNNNVICYARKRIGFKRLSHDKALDWKLSYGSTQLVRSVMKQQMNDFLLKSFRIRSFIFKL
jgi:hypothetical protein